MGGFLVPDTYVVQAPGTTDMNVASIIWGISLAAGVFTASKARKQTWGVYKRTGGFSSYIIMVWLSWLASSIIGVVSWLYLWGTIETSFWLFFFLLVAWVFQVQCIIQIIINRIALLMRDRKIINRMIWSCALGLGVVNISVFCIWIPARLQISPTFVHINEIWDRVEKCIFCLMDVALNIYFVYLVRSRLISNGLTKYNRLFKFNLFMIFVSMSLDIVLIGVMSLGQGFIYVQFHPLVYILKLHIELNMADLIAKIVKSENNGSSYPSSGNKQSGSKSGGVRGTTNVGAKNDSNPGDPRGFRMATLITANRDFDNNHPSSSNGGGARAMAGIQKTTEVHHVIDEDNESRTSSTTELQKDYAIV
ncbi:uncharacterized protein PG986_009744 [Apiospora aurea]|uniref:Uncharacterized protein n=1 Tax=Apiospora aurea TaxID=335848 RepID=A0ABR1Q8I2_9PEZI